jgi:triacylglycerol lipase
MTPRDYALLAQEAYSATPDIGRADSASRAIVRQTDTGLVVAFPGTDNLDCWGADFDVEAVMVPGAGRLHRGFLDAWRAISVPVLAAIAGKPVTLVGHSLGGAIAIMAAVDMMISGNPPVAVYGFEPPRVSPDISIRVFLRSVPLHLYRNGNDIVPDIPPDWYQAAPLNQIGTALLPIPNVQDHALARVIMAFPEQA